MPAAFQIPPAMFDSSGDPPAIIRRAPDRSIQTNGSGLASVVCVKCTRLYPAHYHRKYNGLCGRCRGDVRIHTDSGLDTATCWSISGGTRCTRPPAKGTLCCQEHLDAGIARFRSGV